MPNPQGKPALDATKPLDDLEERYDSRPPLPYVLFAVLVGVVLMLAGLCFFSWLFGAFLE